MAAVGIDLGTTRSCVSYFDTKTSKPVTIHLSHHDPTIPSTVTVYDNGSWHVGRHNIVQPAPQGAKVYGFVKRTAGRTIADPSLLKDIETFELGAKINDDGHPIYTIQGEEVYPMELQALILMHLRKLAEDMLGNVMEGCIGVPAYFTDEQRQQTRQAARIAGFTRVTLAVEPTAAIAAAVWETSVRGMILCVDIGGGTTDLTLARVSEEGKTVAIHTKAIDGNPTLGGHDNTRDMAEQFRKLAPQFPLAQLMEKCEAKKYDLRGSDEMIEIAAPEKTYRIPQAQYLEVSKPRFQEIREMVEKVLAKCDGSLPKVLYVGGGSRQLGLKEYLADLLGEAELVKTMSGPQEIVSHGAALLGAGVGIKGVDILARDLCVECVGDTFKVMIDRWSPLPASYTWDFEARSEHDTSIELSERYSQGGPRLPLARRQVNVKKGTWMELAVEARSDSAIYVRATKVELDEECGQEGNEGETSQGEDPKEDSMGVDGCKFVTVLRVKVHPYHEEGQVNEMSRKALARHRSTEITSGAPKRKWLDTLLSKPDEGRRTRSGISSGTII